VFRDHPRSAFSQGRQVLRIAADRRWQVSFDPPQPPLASILLKAAPTGAAM
jgi:hypothetical protein